MGNCCGCRSRVTSIDDKEESGEPAPPNPQPVPLGLNDAVLIDIIYYDEAPPPPPTTTVGAIEPTSSLTASNTLADFYACAANAIQTTLGLTVQVSITRQQGFQMRYVPHDCPKSIIHVTVTPEPQSKWSSEKHSSMLKTKIESEWDKEFSKNYFAQIIVKPGQT